MIREVAQRRTRKAIKRINTHPALLNRKNKSQSLNRHRPPQSNHHKLKRPLCLLTSTTIQMMIITILLHPKMTTKVIPNRNRNKTLKTLITIMKT